MFEATKQFFAKNKTLSSQTLQKVEHKPSCNVKNVISKTEELSTEVYINHIKNNNKMCKNIIQQEQYQYKCSPTEKNMDQWLSRQSRIPSIEDNVLETESTPEIEGMINTHMTNEFRDAFCFDMPQEIFYDLD